ncbi:scarecrow-like protein 3 [Impatiens glandulifera]|uniref:scarecrow-like protein 3 n=1 Tax=Impatiens glandulifera TaxID=253017 RepID=UPI001FB0558E|nr:scarecrow-like protein 3 [Impatiens glandulifera]
MVLFPSPSPPGGDVTPFRWLRETMNSEERGLSLISLLVGCAGHISSGNFDNAMALLVQIDHLATLDGDRMQRIACYFNKAFADRILKSSWSGYGALNSTNRTSVFEDIQIRRLFFELCPFLRISYSITNEAIIEAMEGEKMVHIVDLNCFAPDQWVNLLHSLRARPEGPPMLRITGVHEQQEVLNLMGRRLKEEADRLTVPFRFNPIASKLELLDIESLHKSGEALAICSLLKLNSLLALEDTNSNSTCSPGSTASSSSSSSPLQTRMIAGFLNSLYGLSPKILVMMEQEWNGNNNVNLVERVEESMNFYGALFDSLEANFPRMSPEREKIEKMMFGEEIKNIVACEGAERRERHEKLERWMPRLELGGFWNVPFNYHGRLQAMRLLRSCGFDGFDIKDQKGCLVICWKHIPLYSISAWRLRYSGDTPAIYGSLS